MMWVDVIWRLLAGLAVMLGLVWIVAKVVTEVSVEGLVCLAVIVVVGVAQVWLRAKWDIK